MTLSGAQIILETLIEEGCEKIFGYPGGAVLDIYDQLPRYSSRIEHILCAHEQGATHAADGYARVSGKVGVVFATSGPGATNTITGIANAFLDSVPMLIFTGNVSLDLMGRDSFQEVDVIGVTMPITKHNYIVKDVKKLAETIREAFRIARSGRPGPVLIDIPKNVQIDKCEYTHENLKKYIFNEIFINENDINKISEIINNAKKPIIYCGGGVIISDAGVQVSQLSDKINAPICFSMMGLTAINNDNPMYLGMTGTHGTSLANTIMSEADVIIALGVRFSERAIGKYQCFSPSSVILHIDIDASEINKTVKSYASIVGDIKQVLICLIPHINNKKNVDWLNRIIELKNIYKNESDLIQNDYSSAEIIKLTQQYTDVDTPIITDVGQHQMWVAHNYRFRAVRTFITSGGLGAMGFGMGAAIGACIASKKRVVLFTGDGSFNMNMNELTTAVSNRLPIVIILFNNGVLGMVREWQKFFFNENYSQTSLKNNIDYELFAKSMGAEGATIKNLRELRECLDKAFNCATPYVINCLVDKDEPTIEDRKVKLHEKDVFVR